MPRSELIARLRRLLARDSWRDAWKNVPDLPKPLSPPHRTITMEEARPLVAACIVRFLSVRR